MYTKNKYTFVSHHIVDFMAQEHVKRHRYLHTSSNQSHLIEESIILQKDFVATYFHGIN